MEFFWHKAFREIIFLLFILVLHKAFAELKCFSIVFERLIFGLVEWFLNNLGSTCGYQYILRLSIHVIIRQQAQARQNLLQNGLSMPVSKCKVNKSCPDQTSNALYLYFWCLWGPWAEWIQFMVFILDVPLLVTLSIGLFIATFSQLMILPRVWLWYMGPYWKLSKFYLPLNI